MYQFMGDDIKAKGKQFHIRLIFQHGMNRMVLKANFVKVENAGAECSIFPMALITHDLCKRTIDNFFRYKINKGFNIIFRAKPLACRHLVMITDQFFGHRDRIIDDFNLMR